jgi:hypothetical protein
MMYINNRGGLDRVEKDVQTLEVLSVFPTVIRGFFPSSYF